MMTSMGLPRNISENWATGYMLGQPNFSMWIDDTTGLTCLAIRDEQGLFYHGYVGIENTHPLFGCPLDELPKMRVHRGLDHSQVVEHYHWLGFHCCHKLDLAPGFGKGRPCDQYRNFDYVQQQCEQLAIQLALLMPND